MSGDQRGALQDRPSAGLKDSILWKPFVPSLYVGAATGACGVAYGSIAGVLIQSSSPLAYTSLAATQWFSTGATYFYCRSVLLSGHLSRDKSLHTIAASGVAGSCSGAVFSIFLPRGSLVSGSIMFGIAAAVSQAGLNAMQGSTSFSPVGSSVRDKLSALSPMKSLSDKEYEDLLLDKLFKVDVEIAVLDDQIADLRAARAQNSRAQQEAQKDHPS